MGLLSLAAKAIGNYILDDPAIARYNLRKEIER